MQKTDTEESRPEGMALVIYIGAAALILYASFANQARVVKSVWYSEFVAAVHDGSVESVRVTNSEFVGSLKAKDKSAHGLSAGDNDPQQFAGRSGRRQDGGGDRRGSASGDQ